MANTRCFVNACLKATGASNSYTEEMEDFKDPGGIKNGEEDDKKEPPQSSSKSADDTGELLVSDAQIKRLKSIWKKENPDLPGEEIGAHIKSITNSESSKSIPRSEYEGIIGWIKNWKRGGAPPALFGPTEEQYLIIDEVIGQTDERNLEGAKLKSATEWCKELGFSYPPETRENADKIIIKMKAALV